MVQPAGAIIQEPGRIPISPGSGASCGAATGAPFAACTRAASSSVNHAGLALTWQASAFGWSGGAAPGDSGSAVRVNTGMQAAGDLTHLVVDTNWLPSYIAGTRISRILQIAGQPLANSPLC